MDSRHAFVTLSATVAAMCLTVLAATLLAEASSTASAVAWWTPQNVSDPTGTDSDTEPSPDIGIDMTGTVHLVWTQGSSESTRDPCYAYSTDGGYTWPSPVPKHTTLGSYETTLAVSDGTVHTAWWEMDPSGPHFYLYYSSISAGSWGSTDLVTDTTDNLLAPAIAQAEDDIHVLWSQGPQGGAGPDLYYSRRALSEGTWDVATLVADTESWSRDARMATDATGDLHVVWHEYRPQSGLSDIVYYISGTVGTESTTWSSEPVTISEGVNEATTPDIVVGSDYTVHVAFGEWISDTQQYVWYAKFPTSDPNSMTSQRIVSSSVAVSANPKYLLPRVALNGLSEVHVVFNGKMGVDVGDVIYHIVSEDQGTTWSTPIAVSKDEGLSDQYPALAMGGDGVGHAAWQQTSGADRDIYYARSVRMVMYCPLILSNY